MILTTGEWLFCRVKGRRDKKQDAYDSIRSAIRRLGHLYNHFKKHKKEISFLSSCDQNNSADIFLRENFQILKWTVEIYTSSDKEEPKSGLKADLYCLIKDAAEKWMGAYLGKNDDDPAEKVRKFMALLKLRKDEIFADATFNLNKLRNVKNRKPSELPDKDDILTIKEYVIKRMGEITNDRFLLIDVHLYVELRDCANTRLIIINERWGGEPSLLTISEWKEAENDVWLDKKRLKEIQEEATNGAKITFQTGKGINRLVSLMTPKDTIKAMQVLSDPVVRSNAGV